MAPDTLPVDAAVSATNSPEPRGVMEITASSPGAAGVGERLIRFAGSIPVTFALVGLLAACAVMGSVLQSFYSAVLAHELVYQTWWFGLVLGLLAANVLCAAVVQLPWQRRQFGLRIAQAGLLVLIAGGLLDRTLGMTGRIALIDSAEPDVRRSAKLPHQTDAMEVDGRHELELYRIPANPMPDNPILKAITAVLDGGKPMTPETRGTLAKHYWSMEFAPGSLTWRDGDRGRSELPLAIRALQKLDGPCPGRTWDLDGGATLEVENFHPHTDERPYSPSDDEHAFAALRLRFASPLSGSAEQWVTSQPGRSRQAGPLALELMGLEEPVLLPEFLNPPAAGRLGKNGELVLALGNKRFLCRLAVDALKPGVAVELSGTPFKLALKRTGDLMDLLEHKDGPLPERKEPVAWPAVHFELIGPQGKGEYLVCARLPQMPAHLRGDRVTRLAAWHHAPDFRFGASAPLGSLQFLHCSDGKVYYRAYGKDGLKDSGREIDIADPNAEVSLPWTGMEYTFHASAWLPRAVKKTCVVARPAAEADGHSEPAIRCVLQSGGQREEFWVRMTAQAMKIQVGHALYFARYRPATRKLGFDVTLKEAREMREPGMEEPAGYESDLELSFPGDNGIARTNVTLAMNRALDRNGYKIVQKKSAPLKERQSEDPMLDGQGRRVSRSELSLTHDPGLPFKYTGSVMMLVGIAAMFCTRTFLGARRS